MGCGNEGGQIMNKHPEENTNGYRRGYYEGFMAGIRVACDLNPEETIPAKFANLAIRLHISAIANRDDVAAIEPPPPNTLPASEPSPTYTRNRPALAGYAPHWSDDL